MNGTKSTGAECLNYKVKFNIQMIQIDKIKFGYAENDLMVFNNLTIELSDNQPISILGPSGCGKSTLLRCVSGYLSIFEGTIKINSYSPEQARINKKIGFAFQEPALLEWCNVEENIILPEKIGKKVMENIESKERLRFLLQLTELEKFKKYYPYQLSGGMKQRVSLARALFTKPDLLLLDEPFASLDLLTRTQLAINLRKMINEIRTPTILVTHSIEEAIIFANRIIILTALPAKVKEIIDIELEFENIKSLESVEFLSIVSKCRSLLLNETKN
ncbi:ABC transporter ATP-binding protein [Candidatus Nomurabacteria bacterium]|nr:ABC transporter ATP-binding protein [Candidatus Nomurabacteria bacterium]